MKTLLRRLALLGLATMSFAAAGQQITVSAAASLTDVLREIGTRFESARPGATVRFNFAASGVLVQQIVRGAPADVFVSADVQSMDRGIREGVLDAAARRDVAANALVLIAPAQGGVPLRRLEDLAAPGVKRIAIGKPETTPAGRYARQSLEAAGLWAPLGPRLVQADSVRQVLEYVSRGEAEAGFLYRTDAQLMPGKVRIVLTAAGHDPVRYPATTVSDSRQPLLARAFVEFMLAPESQAILRRHGFSAP